MDITYKRPESILVVVYTRSGDVLVLRRTNPDDFWQSVTGSLEWGELAADAAQRELREETGITASINKSESDAGLLLIDHKQSNCFPILSAWKPRYDPQIDHNIEHVYSLCLDEISDIELDAEEHTEYQWLARDAAIEKVTSYTNKKAIADVVPL